MYLFVLKHLYIVDTYAYDLVLMGSKTAQLTFWCEVNLFCNILPKGGTIHFNVAL